MPKSNDFHILIEWMYLPSFRWIDKIPFKLSSGQAYPSKKDIFGHVTSLIGRNVTAVYPKKFPKATAYTCQIWKESTQQSQSYKENETRSWWSLIFSHIQTSVPLGTLNNMSTPQWGGHNKRATSAFAFGYLHLILKERQIWPHQKIPSPWFPIG